MTNQERAKEIIRKLKIVNEEMTELYDFIAMIEALTTDRNTAERIRTFMEKKGAWQKIEKQ